MDKKELVKLGTTEQLKRALGVVTALNPYRTYYTYSPSNLEIFEAAGQALIEAVKDYREYHK